MILAGGGNWRKAQARAEVAAQAILAAIRRIGLRAATNKTEAIWFYGRGQGFPPRDAINIDGVPVIPGPTVKYLGLHLDGRWAFTGHFRAVAERVTNLATAFRGILPNLGGPSNAARRLYANMVRAVAMYGAPVWANDLAANRMSQTALERAFHPVAVRASRTYRTVSARGHGPGKTAVVAANGGGALAGVQKHPRVSAEARGAADSVH
ncbi:uncharacterized protein [Cardiocondyla obscurior]|uniref:uncharacterized protein n=1 Tax=Cardiocondyla obscurior TaxID=286306 RepID=UPI0039656572